MPKKYIPIMSVYCPQCLRKSEYSLTHWHCTCGNAWEPLPDGQFDPLLIKKEDTSLWRYRPLMNLNLAEPLVSLEAGVTPLLSASFIGREVRFKVEYLNPSGSFKDRGTEVMINVLKSLGVQNVVEDSSGNAGASLAAYAARAGMSAEIYAPETASPIKLSQIEIYGARVNKIPGPRVNAAQAVLRAIEQGAIYASHAWNPAYLLGQETSAWEVWEQLGQRAPDMWVTPVGQGGHFLGIWLGFKRLLAAGLIEKLPRMVAVQSERMAPICKLFHEKLSSLPEVNNTAITIAEGVVVSNPLRWKRIRQALQESGGTCLSIPEENILSARENLAQIGFFVEPTSALIAAALPAVYRLAKPEEVIVASLTGNGLKVPIKIVT
jgi:threonine synthase